MGERVDGRTFGDFPRESVHSKQSGELWFYIKYAAGVLGLSLLFATGTLQFYQFLIDREIDKWSSKVEGRLASGVLADDEKFYPRVKVVGAGVTLKEALDMEERKTPVEVWNLPNRFLPEVPLGSLGSKVIGQVAVGNRIHDVILNDGWGMTNCPNIEGFSSKNPADKPRVCVIDSLYLLNDTGLTN